ncbi:MAG: 16S rRNA (cytosine(1402)-N(4))-methyltransferase RsmH [bacterium]|nr:16S rRNA (cytosine(1402)-N(4))-methyltransferase RsmH [bacterium]
MKSIHHVPVMANEVVDALNIHEEGIYVDTTAGEGGHSECILSKLSPKGKLILIDRDPLAIEFLQKKFSQSPNVRIKKAQFSMLNEVLNELHIEKVDGILSDLGVSTFQLLSPVRGFSMHYPNAMVDMRMGEGKTALEWLSEASNHEIEMALIQGADFQNVKTIVQRLKQSIQNHSIQTIGDLILSSFQKIPPKNVQARFLQAIRIAVNDELNELKKLLITARERLRENGRLVIITFHSGEAKIVKQEFQSYEMNEKNEKIYHWYPIGGEKKLPTKEERKINKRSNSAVLRYAERR